MHFSEWSGLNGEGEPLADLMPHAVAELSRSKTRQSSYEYNHTFRRPNSYESCDTFVFVLNLQNETGLSDTAVASPI